MWTPNPDPSSEILFDSRGARRMASLFLETSRDKNKEPILTLMDYEKNGLPSAYLHYMQSDTEYEAAMKLVGSMTHWRKLCNQRWFLKGDLDRGFTGLEQWRKDMAMRDANLAMVVLKERVRDGDRQAAQFLLQYATKGDIAGKVKPVKVGRPKIVKDEPEQKIEKAKVTDLAALRKTLEQVPGVNE